VTKGEKTPEKGNKAIHARERTAKKQNTAKLETRGQTQPCDIHVESCFYPPSRRGVFLSRDFFVSLALGVEPKYLRSLALGADYAIVFGKFSGPNQFKIPSLEVYELLFKCALLFRPFCWCITFVAGWSNSSKVMLCIMRAAGAGRSRIVYHGVAGASCQPF
jgi:hypothetical protein